MRALPGGVPPVRRLPGPPTGAGTGHSYGGLAFPLIAGGLFVAVCVALGHVVFLLLVALVVGVVAVATLWRINNREWRAAVERAAAVGVAEGRKERDAMWRAAFTAAAQRAGSAGLRVQRVVSVDVLNHMNEPDPDDVWQDPAVSPYTACEAARIYDDGGQLGGRL